MLSHKEADRVVGKGILEALVRLSKSRDESTRSTCAAALWELTNLQGSDPSKLVPALIQMLRDPGGSKIKGDCAAALYNLAQDMKNCILMMEEDCLIPLLSLIAVGQNFGTRVQACAILSRLSNMEEFCAQMATKEFLQAMFVLAELEVGENEEVEGGEGVAKIRILKTQQRIVNTIYNISKNAEGRKLLLACGTAKFLSTCSTRPSEDIR